MANFSAADVKKLREDTGAGMMDAKKALTETDGDYEAAVEYLRVHGAAKAAKRGAEREASNGLVANAGSTLVQLAAETDFVAKNEEFQALANQIVEAVDAAGASGVEAANAVTLAGGETVADAVSQLSAKIGEKLELAGAEHYTGDTHVYLHRRSSDLHAQVGVLLEYTGGADESVLHGVAMQIAAMRPQYVTREEVPADVIANEERIAEATAREEGKPEKALPKIVEGRVNGYYKDVVLLEQPSVSEDKKTVGQILDAAGITVTRFVRLEAGA
ncbi:MAG: elongation factor Ts [Propionibacterium sp.]|nr:elongation factor Ts [Propionibacterium sp.]